MVRKRGKDHQVNRAHKPATSNPGTFATPPKRGTGGDYEWMVDIDESITAKEVHQAVGHHRFLRKMSEGQWTVLFREERDLARFIRYLNRRV